MQFNYYPDKALSWEWADQSQVGEEPPKPPAEPPKTTFVKPTTLLHEEMEGTTKTMGKRSVNQKENGEEIHSEQG